MVKSDDNHRFSVEAPACRLLENVGMRREAEFVKNQRTIEGDWVDTVWYAALEEEYLGAEDDSSKTSSGDVERNDPATRV